MNRYTDIKGVLPKIKCSDCLVEVDIAEMGDHICIKPLRIAPKTITPPPDSNDRIRDGASSRNRPRSKSGRVVPPRIETSLANRPFLPTGPLTPASSDGSRNASPLSPTPGSKSPFRPPKRSQTTPLTQRPPSPELTNLDSPFPPFTRPNANGSSTNRSRSRTLGGADDMRYATPRNAPKAGTTPRRDDDVNRNGQAQRPSPSQLSRNDSYTNTRPGGQVTSATSNSQVGILDRVWNRQQQPQEQKRQPAQPSMPNGVPEVPPLPAGFSYTKLGNVPAEGVRRNDSSGTNNANNGKRRSSSEAFGPAQPSKPRVLQRKATADKAPTADRDDVQRSASNSSRQGALGRLLSFKRQDDQATGTFSSVSNFARGLGSGEAQHSTKRSTSSSVSGTSVARSGSTLSSRPSNASRRSARVFLESKNSIREANNSNGTDLPKPANIYAKGWAALIGSQQPSQPSNPTFQRAPPINPFREKEPGQVEPMTEVYNPTPKTLRKSASLGNLRKSRCRGCDQIITGKSVSSADGRLTGRYHKACFVCATCQAPFQTADFYVLDNNPYCGQHYHELNGSLCNTCNRGIEGPCLETDEPSSSSGKSSTATQKFHPDCFKCKICRIVLQDDYFEWNSNVYCERDARRAAAVTPPPLTPSASSFSRLEQIDERRPYSQAAGRSQADENRYQRSVRGYPSERGANSRRYPERRTTRLMMI